MLCNEIRPDCWFPVILYNTDNERKESATVPYGSFKNVWQVGDIIEIAWKDTVPSIVYPLKKKWISKKVLCYVMISIVSFLAFFLVIANIGG